MSDIIKTTNITWIDFFFLVHVKEVVVGKRIRGGKIRDSTKCIVTFGTNRMQHIFSLSRQNNEKLEALTVKKQSPIKEMITSV